jgi:hypothetical protein
LKVGRDEGGRWEEVEDDVERSLGIGGSIAFITVLIGWGSRSIVVGDRRVKRRYARRRLPHRESLTVGWRLPFRFALLHAGPLVLLVLR